MNFTQLSFFFSVRQARLALQKSDIYSLYYEVIHGVGPNSLVIHYSGT